MGEGGWFVDLLLPSTDRGVLIQAVVAVAVFALLYRPARRSQLPRSRFVINRVSSAAPSL